VRLSPTRESDVVEELSQHLDDRYRELRAGGASPEEATRAASVALLIGLVGIYGVSAYAVAQRTREIGVRMALGAQLAEVRNMFLRHGMRLTGIGILIGIGVAVIAARVVSGFLFGVGPMDPATHAVVSGTLAAVALLAAYLPARRAARVDPIAALRADV
jgi:ABC-type antimicrobial peptide transport system permease subunit